MHDKMIFIKFSSKTRLPQKLCRFNSYHIQFHYQVSNLKETLQHCEVVHTHTHTHTAGI